MILQVSSVHFKVDAEAVVEAGSQGLVAQTRPFKPSAQFWEAGEGDGEPALEGTTSYAWYQAPQPWPSTPLDAADYPAAALQVPEGLNELVFEIPPELVEGWYANDSNPGLLVESPGADLWTVYLYANESPMPPRFWIQGCVDEL